MNRCFDLASAYFPFLGQHGVYPRMMGKAKNSVNPTTQN